MNKAAGADGLRASWLRLCAAGISQSLTQLFNYSLCHGTFPKEWKLANVAPMHKVVRIMM